MGDWSEVEMKRYLRREDAMDQAGLWQDEKGGWHEGISKDEAQDAAQQLLYRDRDASDDRRVCFECRHLDGRKCRALRFEPVRIVLWRCDRFKLKAVKK